MLKSDAEILREAASALRGEDGPTSHEVLADRLIRIAGPDHDSDNASDLAKIEAELTPAFNAMAARSPSKPPDASPPLVPRPAPG
jgi:hypothetical protein